jgi:predicted nucleotidyltransferase/DNA-binding transcriptional regulator YhcF (GntR family)
MRTSPILTALFPAVRQEILAATLLSPERAWYLSELAAHLKTSPSSLQRELEALATSGILQRRQEGRRTYYKAETTSPVFTELRDLFSKTAGVVPLLQAELVGFGPKITWAAIYGSIARGQERAQSDVDLLIVGPVNMHELLPALRRVERHSGREVNVTRYSEDEFRAKRHSGNHFLNSILKSNLITIAGSPDELEKIASRRQSPHAQNKQKGAKRVSVRRASGFVLVGNPDKTSFEDISPLKSGSQLHVADASAPRRIRWTSLFRPHRDRHHRRFVS